MQVKSYDNTEKYIEKIFSTLSRRTDASPAGVCPIDISLKFLSFCHSQSCGKCVPCRVGIARLISLIQSVVDCKAQEGTFELIKDTAATIMDSADCVIGSEAAKMILESLEEFSNDYYEHIHNNRCLKSAEAKAPCIAKCPADVDVPGYIALINEGKNEEAVRLIRKDNPLPVACAYVCEHPCEIHCRRNMIDDAINIRALKRFAVDNCGEIEPQISEQPTGKSVGVIGGGPSGLTVANYLALMGHNVIIYEEKKELGGMLRYGIPNYRLPKDILDRDIKAILKNQNITALTNTRIGRDIPLEELRNRHDCIYLAIGDHNDRKMGIPGEEANGVISAVSFLRDVGMGKAPNLTGKRVIVVGAGNVAMDATRTAIRLGASPVRVVYRRRREDMPAQAGEINAALEEGAALYTLQSPDHIEADEAGNVVALWTKPQIVGKIGSDGRPKTYDSQAPLYKIQADIIIAAIGQAMDTTGMESLSEYLGRGKYIADKECRICDGVYAGGDCVTGPATVIKAVEAGKVAAINIDRYLGYEHTIKTSVVVPRPMLINRVPMGRVNTTEREAEERKHDFVCSEVGLTCQEAMQEASRCLRCDHYGYGIFREGK